MTVASVISIVIFYLYGNTEAVKNALIVLGKRYLKKNQHGKVIENPKEMFHRVANHVAQFDIAFKTGNAARDGF